MYTHLAEAVAVVITLAAVHLEAAVEQARLVINDLVQMDAGLEAVEVVAVDHIPLRRS